MTAKKYYYSCTALVGRDAQARRFRALGAQEDEIFIDISEEKTAPRSKLRLLKQYALRPGDVLTIPTLYCLSDLKKGLADELHWLHSNKICLRIADIPMCMQAHDEGTQAFLSEMLYEVIDATILKETASKRQKQSEGIRAAQEKGVHIGRRPIERGEAFELLREQWQRGEISLREAGRKLGVSHQTFKKWVVEQENPGDSHEK